MLFAQRSCSSSATFTSTWTIRLTDMFNLKQHVAVPNIRSGHILDLVISSKVAEGLKVNELVVKEQLISDHKAINFAFS